jgi:hypothetical protein
MSLGQTVLSFIQDFLTSPSMKDDGARCTPACLVGADLHSLPSPCLCLLLYRIFTYATTRTEIHRKAMEWNRIRQMSVPSEKTPVFRNSETLRHTRRLRALARASLVRTQRNSVETDVLDGSHPSWNMDLHYHSMR